MYVERCDLCKKKEPNKRFKVKMSRKGCYIRTGYGISWTNLWQPYEKISVCKIILVLFFCNKSSKPLDKKLNEIII